MSHFKYVTINNEIEDFVGNLTHPLYEKTNKEDLIITLGYKMKNIVCNP